MSNLSKEKRKLLISFIESLKENDESDSSLDVINELYTELVEKKYGLLWEEHEERVEKELKTKIPIFKEKTGKRIFRKKEGDFNFLIEGDNLHSLYLLEKTHRSKVDIIYIDPPYNTRKKDFKYDDDFVDIDDDFKHSKWLSFMNARLKIARELLSDDGLIFMSIDDKEQAQLKMLSDSIFGEHNFIIQMPRQTKKSGKTTGSFSKNHDYVLVYTKKNKNIFKMQEHIDDNYKYEDEYIETRGKYKLNQTLDYDSLSYSPNMDYPLIIDGEEFYPGGDYNKYLDRKKGNNKRADWTWRWSHKAFKFGYENGFIVVKRKKDGTARIYTKTYLNAKIEKDKSENYYIDYVKKTKPMSSIELTENIYSNDRAKKELDFFNLKDDFEYAKPVELVKALIKNHKNKDAIVLDFFAGSGTTAEAVLQANIEDEGNRKFILCTNNENQICEKVTYKRLSDLITNYNKILTDEEILYEKPFNKTMLKSADKILAEVDDVKDLNKNKYSKIKVSYSDNKLSVIGVNNISIKQGIPANLKYFKTEYLNKFNDQETIISEELMNSIKEMIELENGIDLLTSKVKLIQSEEELETFINSKEMQYDTERLYMSSNILMSAVQERIIKDLNMAIEIIPDYYFAEELKEAGEL